MKYRLYLEASRLAQFESYKTSSVSYKTQIIPVWLQWLWQHRSGGAMANIPLDQLGDEKNQPLLPIIVLYESSKTQENERAPIPHGHLLILEWKGKGSGKTLRIRHKSMDQTWPSTSDPADMLKAIRQGLRHCSHAAKSIKRSQDADCPFDRRTNRNPVLPLGRNAFCRLSLQYLPNWPICAVSTTCDCSKFAKNI